MNDTHPQQHANVAKEEISDTPTLFAEDPRLSLPSRFDEDQLDPSLDRLDQQLSKLNFHGRNSAVEKSFKDEEYIYVSMFSPLYLDLQNDRYFNYR